MFDMLRTIFAFIVDIGVLIFFHELGHYLAARSQGVTVETFSVGFGPALLKYKAKKSGTVWQVSALPLGGYVKMQGWGEEQTKGPARPGSFAAASLGSKAVIVAAGPLANLLLAVVIYAGLFMSTGQVTTQPVLNQIQLGSPAAESHLQAGDRVLAIGDAKIHHFSDLQQIVVEHPDTVLDFTIERAGKDLTLPVTVGETTLDGEKIGHLGVIGTQSALKRLAPGPAIAAAFHETGRQISGWFSGMATLIVHHKGLKDLAGPLGIAEISGQAAALGLVSVISLIAVLSINLGLVNLIPIPILDGGHLLFYLVEFIIRRPVPEQAREAGLRVGVLFILSLVVLVTFNDLTRLGAFAWFSHLL
ncbi:RIP metalloprotease RseP [Acidocella aminolytica]|jgi:regulator of sigma E protease|uniref:Zinc metalloprotease n=1 Tax=Acidocella aminolytica 101 = DSM 11237 TaxID=1120923 RepID=A0A0D6PDJ3_9PROT|nr:RIP metalloprotease RseP [Acidocella aminolytica]GAN78939.1 zinc metallopeptidase [Acidocella aminolytica 101 = DSM 11237]GBQ42187.1 putative zinc metallopeptidase [Acidocella aminolytica 101 = DSM 11237]SHE99777.1 regulator of sigma E protease [Acidocella aminolytica 101 = DSM 11237]